MVGKFLVNLQQSRSAPQSVDFAAVVFRRSARWGNFKLPRRYPLFCQFLAQFPARLGLAIERLRDRGGATYFAEEQDFHLEIASITRHLQ